MDKKEICIIIPIYKIELNDFEMQSVKQCINLLSDYSIHFVCPEGLIIDFYKTRFQEIENFTFFDKYYFKDLKGYNRLMLNVDFYKTFKKYKYMLIHQTDCFVFRDELLNWSERGYDYIGGIWFEDFVGNPYHGAKIWYAGNGGFSLRKINSIINLLTSKKPIKKLKELFLEKKKLYTYRKITFFKELFLLPFNLLGYKNNYKYLAENYNFNEDFFYIESGLKNESLKVPNAEDVLQFSWDRFPNFLYDKIGSFPFGCHAWFRDDFPYEENKNFWLNNMKINNLK